MLNDLVCPQTVCSVLTKSADVKFIISLFLVMLTTIFCLSADWLACPEIIDPDLSGWGAGEGERGGGGVMDVPTLCLTGTVSNVVALVSHVVSLWVLTGYSLNWLFWARLKVVVDPSQFCS